MLKLETGMFNERGFTLIEILVVLLIVGITIGFAMLAFGDFGAQRRAMFAIEQFVNDIKLVQHQAAIEISTYGVYVNQNDYQVFRFDPSGQWLKMTTNHIFRQHSFPTDVSVRFQPKIASHGAPQIVVNESGDMTSFHLMVELKGVVIGEVIGRHNGALQLKKKTPS